MGIARVHFFKLFCMLLLSTLVFHVGAVRATQQTFLIQDGTRTSGWAMVYNDTEVSSPSFTGNPSGTLQGTLSLTKTFNSMAPIALEFIELAPAASDNFGFRVNLNETVVNQSGQDWVAFKLDTIDTNAFYDSFDSFHPGYAHIHPGSIVAPPFAIVTPGGNTGVSNVYLSAGIFVNNTSQNWTGIALHQYEVTGLQRPFILLETPIGVPEPSVLLLATVGLAGVAIYRRHRS